MVRIGSKLLGLIAGILICAGTAWALSMALPSPEITFPDAFSKQKADAIEAVLRDKQFSYVDGLYSHWPPAWGTTLVYRGDTKSLKAMLEGLSRVAGMSARVTFSKDLAKESGTGHSVGNWWVKHSHETPNTITVRVNLAAKEIDLSELELTLASK